MQQLHSGEAQVLQTIVDYLIRHFKDYPYQEKTDDTYFMLLLEDFGDLDLLEELKAYHIWCLNFPVKSSAHRNRFRRWLKRAKEINANNGNQMCFFSR